MRISSWAMYALAVCTAVAILAGCNTGSQSTLGPLAPMQQNVAQPHSYAQSLDRVSGLTTPGQIRSGHPDRRPSWMSPDAKMSTLLYVSDQANGFNLVDVYKYGTNTLVGQLTGFQAPFGECTDMVGDVFVTDFSAQDIVEYAHAGTTPIQILSDPKGVPIGCSVDPISGNLAVSNWYNNGPTGPIAGGVYIYQGAAGSPKRYANSKVFDFWPPGYDNKGNLFLDGTGSSLDVGLYELPVGGKSVRQISLGHTIVSGASVQWDGKYVAVGDQAIHGKLHFGIYRVQVSGLTGKVVGSLELTGGCASKKSDAIQVWIHGTTVLGPNLFCPNTFGYWNYPAGGLPFKTIPQNIAPNYAVGVTVSQVQ
jgi:hypothetical protein